MFLACVFLLCTASLALNSCDKRGPVRELYVVVPDGYTGLVRIILSPQGEPFVLKNGVTTVTLSLDGTAKINAPYLLTGTHWEIYNRSGERVPTDQDSNNPRPSQKNDIAFRWVASNIQTTEGEELWAVIGTYYDVGYIWKHHLSWTPDEDYTTNTKLQQQLKAIHRQGSRTKSRT